MTDFTKIPGFKDWPKETVARLNEIVNINHDRKISMACDVWNKEQEIELLRTALWKAEKKLSAYVGVCDGDKELVDDTLPSVRAALHGDVEQPDDMDEYDDGSVCGNCGGLEIVAGCFESTCSGSDCDPEDAEYCCAPSPCGQCQPLPPSPNSSGLQQVLADALEPSTPEPTRKPTVTCPACHQVRYKGTPHDDCPNPSDTPKSPTDSGVKSDKPQNPDINHVSSSLGDLDAAKVMIEAHTTNPHWKNDYPAWDVHLSNGVVHKGVTQKEIRKAIVSLKEVNPEAVRTYDDHIDVVRKFHIDLYNEYHVNN